MRSQTQSSQNSYRWLYELLAFTTLLQVVLGEVPAQELNPLTTTSDLTGDQTLPSSIKIGAKMKSMGPSIPGNIFAFQSSNSATDNVKLYLKNGTFSGSCSSPSIGHYDLVLKDPLKLFIGHASVVSKSLFTITKVPGNDIMTITLSWTLVAGIGGFRMSDTEVSTTFIVVASDTQAAKVDISGGLPVGDTKTSLQFRISAASTLTAMVHST